jgi:hypothetical protein
VDDLRRNQWPTFSGIGGRFGPESVVDLGRIMHAAQLIAKQKQKADEEVVGIIGQPDEDNQIIVLFESNYSATASCTIAFVKILEQHNAKAYGVLFPFEIMDLQEVLAIIKHRIIS